MSNNTNIELGFVKEQEFHQWLPHWNNYQIFYKVNLSDEITNTTWARFFDDNEKVYCVVAREGDCILGFVHFLYHRSTWAMNYYCYLEDLFVSANHRGQQIGKKLIEFVQHHAKKCDATRLYWHTQEDNLTAQKLYNLVAEKPGIIEYVMPL